jgi:arsenate reductase (glutaredoxin)
MSTSRLLHNPRCSKSRAALALLQERGVEIEVVPYLEQPLDLAELRALVAQGIGARELLRPGEPEYDSLDLHDPALGDDDLLGAVAAHPRLMERPVFVHEGRAIIGRPPERVLELLD